MVTVVFVTLGAAILTELVKGLSANGTPPFLQKFSWQIDLAYFMWSNILRFRIAYIILLAGLATQVSPQHWGVFIVGVVVCVAIWRGVYWFFNKYWIGKYKFLPITQKIFLAPTQSNIDLDVQVIGVELNGEKKAYPANLLFYHHQVSDVIGGKPILATYCGMCQSGRVYDVDWPEGAPEFALVGAVSFNAVLRDSITNSWWRQETGEAAKGPKKGAQLEDVYFEQMSLKNWIEKHPDTVILQYDPLFEQKYNFFAKLLKFEAILPRWHLQKTPPLVIGVDLDGHEKAYDFIELQKNRVVNDTVGAHQVLALTDEDMSSAFVYDRSLNGNVLSFALKDGVIIDQETGSTWTHLGRCIKGKSKGAQLVQLQSYRQFIRAWITFHPNTEFYDFN